MKIIETVALPPVEEQPLVHPLDLPEARRDFRLAFWIRALTSPGTALIIASLSWFVAESWVGPVATFFALAVIGYFAAAWSDREAWSFIPRKRQDRSRTLPFSWELGRSVIVAALLSVGVLLLASRLNWVPTPVREYILGAGTAVAAMSLAVVVIVRSRAVLFSLAWIIGLAASIVLGYFLFFTGNVHLDGVLMGGLITLGIGAIVGGFKLIEQRRERGKA
jgi:hypothetical protein